MFFTVHRLPFTVHFYLYPVNRACPVECVAYSSGVIGYSLRAMRSALCVCVHFYLYPVNRACPVEYGAYSSGVIDFLLLVTRHS